MGIHRTIWCAVALALLVGITPVVSASAAGLERPPTLRPVHATHGAGARIVDDLGRTVILRGVNVNGLGEYYQEFPDLPSTLPLTEHDFAQMAGDGFNVVRLIVSWSRLEPFPGHIEVAELDRIARVVDWARAHGIYVLLDMHQDAWGPAVNTPDGVTCPKGLIRGVGWDGAPAWTTSFLGTVATCTAGARELSFAVQTSFSRFYANALGVQDHLIRVWKAIAQRFAREPAVAGYDLLNEPNPGLAIGVDDYALLGLFYARTIAAIRTVDRRHAVFVEPAVITGPLATPGPVITPTTDRNLVYAPHLYNESISILPGTIEQGFKNAATAARTQATPFFSGEWGWFGDGQRDQPFIERYARNEDANLVGGTWWQWKQACGDPHAVGTRGHRPSCAGKRAESDGLVTRSPANLAVLSRSFPRAVPGRLTKIESNLKTGRLVIEGVADRAGIADLWMSPRCGRRAVPVSKPGPYRIVATCP